MNTHPISMRYLVPTLPAPAWIGFALLLGLLGAGGVQAGMIESDGSDGPFHPTSSQRLILDSIAPDGVLNFTTIHVPPNVTIRFERNARNTPVFLAATGDVIIEGTVEVSGDSFAVGAGPGGWDGGGPGSNAAGTAGSGPTGGEGGPPPVGHGNAGGGAGMATEGQIATSRTGPMPGLGGRGTVRPELRPGQTGGGGSGGGGGGGRLFFGVDIPGGCGGGGGGALQISTPGRLTLGGSLLANGGHGGWAFANALAHGGPGGGGAGGQIELFAGQFVFLTNAIIQARGGAGGGLSTEPVPRNPFLYSSGANGSAGYIYLNRTDAITPLVSLDGAVDTRPQILGITYNRTDRSVSLECRGLTDVGYVIQSSMDLESWTDRGARAPGLNGRCEWVGEEAASQSACFYRLRAP